MLGLNDTQESSLGLVFHYADTKNLLLLDLKDLRAVLTHLTSDEGKAELKSIGGLSAATVGGRRRRRRWRRGVGLGPGHPRGEEGDDGGRGQRGGADAPLGPAVADPRGRVKRVRSQDGRPFRTG